MYDFIIYSKGLSFVLFVFSLLTTVGGGEVETFYSYVMPSLWNFLCNEACKYVNSLFVLLHHSFSLS